MKRSVWKQPYNKSRGLFHGIHQWFQALNSYLQPVAGFDGADAAGSASQNDVAGQEGHVGGDEAYQIEAVENELARVRVLAELAILEKLNRQIVRVDFGLNVRAERRESVE